MPATYAPLGKAAASYNVGAFTYSPLLSDGDDVVSRPGSVASGLGVLKRGTIVKWDPVTGNVTLPAVATDCNAILVDDTDATSAAALCGVYVGGKFRADAVIFPAAISHATVTEALRDCDIQLESVVYTDGTMVKSTPTEAEAEAAKKRIAENQADADKAAKVTAAAVEEPKLSDSSWPYLTPEEREKQPELADPRRADEAEPGKTEATPKQNTTDKIPTASQPHSGPLHKK